MAPVVTQACSLKASFHKRIQQHIVSQKSQLTFIFLYSKGWLLTKSPVSDFQEQKLFSRLFESRHVPLYLACEVLEMYFIHAKGCSNNTAISSTYCISCSMSSAAIVLRKRNHPHCHNDLFYFASVL